MSSTFHAADAFPNGPASYVRRRFTVDEFERMADSSVNYDLRIKNSIYARSTVPEYWVVDLVHDVIEVRRSPVGGEYSDVSTLRRGDIVTSSIPALSGIVADDLLG